MHHAMNCNQPSNHRKSITSTSPANQLLPVVNYYYFIIIIIIKYIYRVQFCSMPQMCQRTVTC